MRPKVLGWRDVHATRMVIGYWHSKDSENKDFPNVHDFVDPDWDQREKAKVIAFLKLPHVSLGYMGWSNCRICLCHNGTEDHMNDEFLWPSGLLHYVECHNVKPPQIFIDMVLKNS